MAFCTKGFLLLLNITRTVANILFAVFLNVCSIFENAIEISIGGDLTMLKSLYTETELETPSGLNLTSKHSPISDRLVDCRPISQPTNDNPDVTIYNLGTSRSINIVHSDEKITFAETNVDGQQKHCETNVDEPSQLSLFSCTSIPSAVSEIFLNHNSTFSSGQGSYILKDSSPEQVDGNEIDHEAEEMDTPKKIPCLGDQKPPELVASYQRDFCSTPLIEIQNLRGNYDTPQKLPPAPHSSPQSEDKSATSRLSDRFTSELLKACSTSFSSVSNPQGINEDITSIPLESTSLDSVVENDSGKSWLRELEYRNTMGLPYCLRNMSLNSDLSSPYSDTSIIAHRESDVSDISSTESQKMFSDDDAVDSRKLEGYDEVDTANPIDCTRVYSPRRPRSSVGEFLSWRKNMRTRRKMRSSSDSIYSSFEKKEKSDRRSEFLKTI